MKSGQAGFMAVVLAGMLALLVWPLVWYGQLERAATEARMSAMVKRALVVPQRASAPAAAPVEPEASAPSISF